MKQFVCAHCGQQSIRKTGHVNRSTRLGWPLYCGKKCAGLARRTNRSIADKKEAKRLYDIEYRKRNEKRLKVARANWFQKDYAANPDKYRRVRKAKQAAHNEYCRQPQYKEWKREYDLQFRAKKFGELWESHLLLVQLEREILKHMTRYEIQLKNKTLNKVLRRGRDGKIKRSYT